MLVEVLSCRNRRPKSSRLASYFVSNHNPNFICLPRFKAAMFCMCPTSNTIAITPKSEDKYVGKCSTAQSFFWTEMSTYRIATLGGLSFFDFQLFY